MKFIPFPINKFDEGLKLAKSGIISLQESTEHEILIRDPGTRVFGEDRTLTIESTLDGFDLYASSCKGHWNVSLVDTSTDSVIYRPQHKELTNPSDSKPCEILAADSLLSFLSEELENVAMIPGHTIYIDSNRFPSWHYLQEEKTVTIFYQMSASSDFYRYFSIWLGDSMVQNFALFISDDSRICIKNYNSIPHISEYKDILEFSQEEIIYDIFGNHLNLNLLTKMFLRGLHTSPRK